MKFVPLTEEQRQLVWSDQLEFQESYPPNYAFNQELGMDVWLGRIPDGTLILGGGDHDGPWEEVAVLPSDSTMDEVLDEINNPESSFWAPMGTPTGK